MVGATWNEQLKREIQWEAARVAERAKRLDDRVGR
jgi:hypothetical protein